MGEQQPVEEDDDILRQPDIDLVLSDDDNQSESSSDEESNVPLQELRGRYPKWFHKDDFDPPLMQDIDQGSDNLDPPQVRKPFEYFSDYFNSSFFEEFALTSNTTYLARYGKELNTNSTEIKHFIGVSIVLTLLGFPRMRMAWESQTRYPLVADTIVRDRFYHLRNNLHIVDENSVSQETKSNDRFWKVRPLCSRVREKCLQYERPREVSIDEQMIPFEGRVTMRQYVKGKPNPVGIKNFVMTSTNGLPLDFILYEGKGRDIVSSKVPAPEKLDVGGKVVLALSDSLPDKTIIYMDRYFTSLNLIDALLQHRSILACGTIMASRIPAAVRFKKDNELRRQRGSHDQVVRNDRTVSMTKWFDNKPIYFATSAHGVHPIENCRRWSKKDARHIEIPRPNVVKRYNESMGGVDLLDRVIGKYGMRNRTEKWTVRVLYHFLDFAIASSWIQYRRVAQLNGWPKKNILSYYFFKLDIAENLIYCSAQSENNDPNSSNSSFDSPEAKKQRRIQPLPPVVARKASHMPEMAITEQKNRSKCRAPGCSKLTFVRCSTCKVFLCFNTERNCFKTFHS